MLCHYFHFDDMKFLYQTFALETNQVKKNNQINKSEFDESYKVLQQFFIFVTLQRLKLIRN